LNYLYFSTHLTTNFKPSSIKSFNNLTFFKKNKNQIYCRNLFMFLILLKYKNKNFFHKSTVFIKPYKKKIYTILRAPYRHKLSRHQITLNRYNIISSIKIKTEKIFNLKKFEEIKKVFYFFKKFNFWFESNIIYNHRIKISYNFYYNPNFELKRFSGSKNKKN
jgi:hypothetical protein